MEAQILLDYQVGPKWNHKYLYKRGNQKEIQYTQKRRQCDRWGRETSDVATSQEMLAATWYWKRQSIDSCIQRVWPWFLPSDIDFGFLATRTVNKYTSVISSHQNSGNLLQQVQETNTITNTGTLAEFSIDSVEETCNDFHREDGSEKVAENQQIT